MANNLGLWMEVKYLTKYSDNTTPTNLPPSPLMRRLIRMIFQGRYCTKINQAKGNSTNLLFSFTLVKKIDRLDRRI